MKDSTHISHIYQTDSGWVIQSNEDHCRGVADLAGRFAEKFGYGEWGRAIGLLHDRGKQSRGFQAYIRRNSGYDPTSWSNLPHEHSYAGAVVAHTHRLDALYWMSNPIAGHHGGLYDISDLGKTLEKALPDDLNHDFPDIEIKTGPMRLAPQEAHHITRMLYSCLVDADWLDTESFMTNDKAQLRGIGDKIPVLKDKLDNFLKQFSELPKTDLNIIRDQIQKEVVAKSEMPTGFYELTVPTGGGKTIASVLWAIHHALYNNKSRIIIAIPFTSIIVQTAAILRNIFGDENVLEHHSALADDVDGAHILATENWDAPIVVTTNVQLFESIFSNRRGACRKLHSICDSVVILDEVQSLPLSFLQPVIDAMRAYEKLFNASFLLCTASQPILEGTHKGTGVARFTGVPSDQIIPLVADKKLLVDKLRRVEITFDDRDSSPGEIACRMSRENRVLCIVNTRKIAYEVFSALEEEENVEVFHLSRLMCPAHLLDTIDKIKLLLRESEKRIRVVSTQLIEAGVDIDFPVVLRQYAGLDSLLQAAGRCNREGRLPQGRVEVFSLMDFKPRGSMRNAIDAMKRLQYLYPDMDWLSPKAMWKYYELLYSNTPSFDKNDINDLLKDPRTAQYEAASKKFKLIDENGIDVIVNYGEAEQLIHQLEYAGSSRRLARQLGRYTVNIRKQTFDRFRKEGLIVQPADGYWYIPLASQYDHKTGLKMDNDYLEQTLVI